LTNELTTNLDQYPYFADFDVNDQYYVELMKPRAVVQTRELNNMQLQTQAQIGMFANNIFVAGTIVSGCSLSYDNNLQYVKVLDNYANGTALAVSSLIGATLVSNTGLTALIKNSLAGFVATAPNLNTFYLKYLNSATTNNLIQVFQNDEILTAYNSSNIAIGQIQVANATSSGLTNTTGYAYGMTCGEGTIYQKGYFLTVDQQSVIIDPYDQYPDGISVGFQSVESVVTALTDPSLYDNAQGAPNFNAPGADRLKIVPSLVVVSTNSISTNTFFSIVNFVQGSPSIINGNTTYSTIGEAIASVSSDTNGDFFISPYNVRALQLFANTSNTQSLDANNIRIEVDSGVSYVDGTRVEIIGKALAVIPKGTTINFANQEILTTQYGSYVNVQDIGGIFDPTQLQKVSLRSANAYASSNNIQKGVSINAMSPPGSEIGTAYLFQTAYISGTPDQTNYQQSFFLGNVTMTGNNPFSAVKSIFANNSNIFGFADIVGNSALAASNFACLIYPFAQDAIASLKTATNTTDTQFEYLSSTSLTFNTSGVASVTIPSETGGTNQLPYGTGYLTTQQIDAGIYLVAEGNCHTVNVAGSVANSNTIHLTGSSTTFTTSLVAGALILIANSTASETRQVNNIVSDTSLNLTDPLTNSWTGANVSIVYLNGENIPLNQLSSNVHVTNSTSFTINLNQSLTATLAANVWYPIQRSSALPTKKNLQTDCWAKINCASSTGGTTGPWSLGVPDAFNLKHVYVGTTYSNTNPDLVTNFTLHNGQQDLFYGLSSLSSNGAALTTSSVMMVQFEAFKQDFSTGAGFFSIASYPVDDTGITTNSIFTQDIPVYSSLALQGPVDLRSSVDFRPYQTNTIPYCNGSLATANTLIINPGNTFSLVTTNLMMPVVDAEFISSLQYYTGRYDQIGLSNSGVVIVNSGIPAINPVPPSPVQSGITLALVMIPPYPSLTIDNPDIPLGYNTVSLTFNSLKRYTMADIGNLDAQIQQLQYYSTLSLLEASAQNLLLTNQSGINRFQNGFLADPMQDFSIANTLAPGFNISIDPTVPEARPIYNQFQVNMNYLSFNGDNTTQSTDANGNLTNLITLDYNEALLITQPFACGIRTANAIANTPSAMPTCQDKIYCWSGHCHCKPEGNCQPDCTRRPCCTTDVQSCSNWRNCNNSWQTQWGCWNDSQTSCNTNPTSPQCAVTSNYNYCGNDSASAYVQPYCAADLVKCSCHGMKPQTRVWCFVNDVPATNNCQQTGNNHSVTANTLLTFPLGNLITDNVGDLFVCLNIPGNTFFYGSNLNIQFCDSDDITATSNISTIATASFFETNQSGG